MLVKAAQGASVFQEEKQEEEDIQLSSLGGGFREELEIQELILRKQKELEKAQAKLKYIQKVRK